MASSSSSSSCQYTTSWEPKMAQVIYSQMEQQQKQQQHNKEQSKSPFMIALVGIPGSGKSTSSQILSNLLQQTIRQQEEQQQQNQNSNPLSLKSSSSSVMVMPMDGYHLTLSTLKSKLNAKELIYRRGAPDTFDPQSLLHDLKRIRGIRGSSTDSSSGTGSTGNSEIIIGNDNTVLIPGFDHAIGDPQPNAYTFDRNQHSFVICEGLYLLHQDQNQNQSNNENSNIDNNNIDNNINCDVSWSTEIEKQFDITIFIDADVDTCIERLKVRNKCIPGYTPEEIDIRCDEVDRANAMVVLKSGKDRAMYVVDSIVATSSS